MFYCTRYRYHGNTAGRKPALNIGFDLFSENSVVRFFPSFVFRKLKNTYLLTLVSWNFDREIFCYFVFYILTFSEHVLCQNSIFVCLRVMRVLDYYSTKFHEILPSGSVDTSAFALNRAVTLFWLTAHALHLTGFSIFLDPCKHCQKGRVFSNSITFNTLENKRFWHKNCLIVKTEKKHLHNLHWTKWNDRCTGAMFVLLSLVRTLIHVSSTNRRACANWVQTP